MTAIVYGTYCNPSPQYGLSFYCQGSTACDVFRNFTAVSCLSQPDRLYCTNQQACGGANFTNDIYIEFPLDGSYTATDYDTVTRSSYQFNQTISVSQSKTAHRRHYGSSIPRGATLSVSQQVQSIFQNIYNRNATSPTKLLVNSLASSLYSLKQISGAPTVTSIQNTLRDSLFAAVAVDANRTIAEVGQCKEINATADGMLDVNELYINNITSQLPQNSLQSWLLTNFVGHIIANSAIIQEVDIIKLVASPSSASSCSPVSSSTTSSSTTSSSTTSSSTTSSSTTSSSTRSTSSTSRSTTSSTSTNSSTTFKTSTATTSKTSTSSTSKSTTSTSKTSTTSTSISFSTSSSTTSSLKITSTSSTTSSTSVQSAVTTSKSSSATKTTTSKSSSSSTTSTTSTSGTSTSISHTLSASSFTPSLCPSATPTGSLIYKSNSTQNQALNGSFSIYNGTSARLQNVLVAPSNGSAALYAFPSSDSIAITLPSGESLIYTTNVSSITYVQSGCGTALKFANASASAGTKKRRRNTPADRRDSTGVSVIMAVQDQCGHPVNSGYALQLDCAKVLYPQLNAVSGPTVEQSQPQAFSSAGGGSYIATCGLADIDSANAAYNTCIKEDSQSLNDFCGKELKAVHSVKDYVEKYIEEAKEFVELAKFVKVLTTVLEKTNPALTFWDRMCNDKYGLMSPWAQAQLDAEDCGYPAALSMGLEGLDGHGTPFTSPLGTFTATPTTIYMSTSTSISATTCSSTQSSITAVPSYLPYQKIGTGVVCDTPGDNSIVAYNSGYIYCYNCWNDLANNTYHVLCSSCSKYCCFAATASQFNTLETQSNYYIIGPGISCESGGFGANDACKNNNVITPDLCATNTSSKSGPNYGYFNSNQPK